MSDMNYEAEWNERHLNATVEQGQAQNILDVPSGSGTKKDSPTQKPRRQSKVRWDLMNNVSITIV